MLSDFGTWPDTPQAVKAFCQQAEQLGDRIERGDYDHRLTAVYGVPKSASRRLAAMLAALMPPPMSDQVLNHPSYAPVIKEYDLWPQVALDRPQGGVLHIQGMPSAMTIKTILRLKINVVITLRHPADQACAMESHVRHMMHRNFVAAGTDQDPDTLAQLDAVRVETIMEDGRMLRSLWFMGEWLRQIKTLENRFGLRCAVARYEDLVAEPAPTLRALGQRVLGAPVDPERLDRAVGMMTLARGEVTVQANPRVYRFGTTGRAGIWRDFFDDNARQRCEDVLKRFIELHPAGDMLIEHYPGLPHLN